MCPNVKTCPDAHQVPTANVPVDQTGSFSNSTKAGTDLCTHTSRHTMLLILCFSWDQSREIVSVSLLFV